MPLESMTSKGYKNLHEKFFARTGRKHNKLQLKNRRDALKSLYNFWLIINKATRFGWDNAKGTVVASDSWWKDNTKVITFISFVTFHFIISKLNIVLPSLVFKTCRMEETSEQSP